MAPMAQKLPSQRQKGTQTHAGEPGHTAWSLGKLCHQSEKDNREGSATVWSAPAYRGGHQVRQGAWKAQECADPQLCGPLPPRMAAVPRWLDDPKRGLHYNAASHLRGRAPGRCKDVLGDQSRSTPLCSVQWSGPESSTRWRTCKKHLPSSAPFTTTNDCTAPPARGHRWSSWRCGSRAT